MKDEFRELVRENRLLRENIAKLLFELAANVRRENQKLLDKVRPKPKKKAKKTRA